MNCHRFYVLVKIVWRYENKTVQYTVFSSAVKNKTETAAVKKIVPRRYFCGGSYCFMSWYL